MSDQIIRASDIADYVYCHRSWWLSRAAGYAPANVQELDRGTLLHRQHGALVRRAVWGRRAALSLVFVVVAIFVFVLLGGA